MAALTNCAVAKIFCLMLYCFKMIRLGLKLSNYLHDVFHVILSIYWLLDIDMFLSTFYYKFEIYQYDLD